MTHHRLKIILAATLLVAIGAGMVPAAELSPLKVVGNQVYNAKGERVRLHGVNAACLEWTSDGEGHILDTIRVAIRDWHSNVVRIPVAQDRWYGKGPEQKDDGAAYRALVKQAVGLCVELGAYAMIDLHWSDAGEWGQAIGQHVMPDRNSATFWKDCAAAYQNQAGVIFDLYNEPHDVSWDQWLDGGLVSETDPKTGKTTTFVAVGMRELCRVVRATGAKNLVVIGGLDWSYDLSGIWQGRQIADPDGQGVIYANHAYPFKGDTVEKWVGKMETASQVLPIIVSEFGSDPDGGAGLSGEAWVRQVIDALKVHDWNYTAWDLHPAAGPKLVKGWDYAPTEHFGVPVKEFLANPARPQAASPAPAPPSAAVGIFEGHGDIGTVRQPGSAEFDPASKTYTLAGSGKNMWQGVDAFQFTWKRVAGGDVSFAADIAFLGQGKDAHRKGCLMIRQSLDFDSAYVDVAVHGDSLTSLQFRDEKGTNTHEVQANTSKPGRVRLDYRDGYATMAIADAPISPKPSGDPDDTAFNPGPGRVTQFSGAATRIKLQGPFYVGIGVCAHDDDTTERAMFRNVELTAGPSPASPTTSAKPPALYSTLETQAIASTDRRVVRVFPGRIEAPNWTKDGSSLIYNGGGKLHRIGATGGEPRVIDTGFANRCNNDHGISPDGTTLAISDGSQGDRKSRIYTVPIAGGSPTPVTPIGPSYWHGWSPDGRTLAYCAQRDGVFDIYTIPASGGAETRLSTTPGLDDGPEYSPDGKTIYFNSDRSGLMQIWRMDPDGSNERPVFTDDRNNWFAHPSPDGTKLVYVSFDKSVQGHPEDKDVEIRLLTLATGQVETLAKLYGGQGTINVPSWSPDGKKIAFVTYQRVP